MLVNETFMKTELLRVYYSSFFASYRLEVQGKMIDVPEHWLVCDAPCGGREMNNLSRALGRDLQVALLFQDSGHYWLRVSYNAL